MSLLFLSTSSDSLLLSECGWIHLDIEILIGIRSGWTVSYFVSGPIQFYRIVHSNIAVYSMSDNNMMIINKNCSSDVGYMYNATRTMWYISFPENMGIVNFRQLAWWFSYINWFGRDWAVIANPLWFG